MSVTLPSDLVADVMRSADPARRDAAIARLDAAKQEQDFASQLDGVATRDFRTTSLVSPPSAGSIAAPPATRGQGKTEAYLGFERMVLRNLFETLLPDQASGAFGGGPSAGVWRSMAADQLAGVYAKDGGIGIARMLERNSAAPGPRLVSQWPYFQLDALGGFKGSIAS